MHLTLNVSLHTTDPLLRAEMLGTTRGAVSIDIFFQMANAGTKMNVQNVLCPEINDGEYLTKTLKDLLPLFPSIESVAFVPVSLTKHFNLDTFNSARSSDNKIKTVEELPDLCKNLRVYTPEEAGKIIDVIDEYGEVSLMQHGVRMFYPADEFFVIAGREIPIYEYYSPQFEQYENGVGMWRCFEYEFMCAITTEYETTTPVYKDITIVTGEMASKLFERMFGLYGFFPLPFTSTLQRKKGKNPMNDDF
jgi:NifB/MoaA-like Fe-S oxidoreductase